MTTNKKIIYIPLLDEGTEVIRPTYGELITDNIFRVLPTSGYNPEDEDWEFPPGSLVICEVEEWEGKQILIARQIMSKPVFEIDGKNFSTLEEFYDEVEKQLIPDFGGFGRNLDAFNDILSGGFGTPFSGFILVWHASNISREQLGYPETVRQLELRLMKKNLPSSSRAKFESKIFSARQLQGPTIFDTLIEIIGEHPEVELKLL